MKTDHDNPCVKDTLFLITARGGSKGIPHKNILPFAGKPLILHSVDHARKAGAADCDICVSTDSDEIMDVVRGAGLEVPFKRPDELASDTAGSYEVILHALDYYRRKGIDYRKVVLLQPTSPLRTPDDILGAMQMWNENLDMVVSVRPARTNPYYNAFETDSTGMLHISKGDGHYTRRQDAPEVWEYNGAVYVISSDSLRKGPMSDFKKIRPYVMPEKRSVDLDSPLDWTIAENIYLSQK